METASPVVADPAPLSKSRLGPSPVLSDPALLSKPRFRTRSGKFSYPPTGSSFSSGVHTITRKKPAKLADVNFNGFLEAMQSSSPHPQKILKDVGVELASDECDAAYYSWLLKYPSALTSFENIINRARNKKLIVFLDYDGTLSPIVDDPDRAFMSPDMRSALGNVANHFPTAIISGRKRDQLYEFVGLTQVYYAGSHGMDIMIPLRDTVFVDSSHSTKSTDEKGEDLDLFQPAREFLPLIDEVFRTLVEVTKDIPGVKVENNKFCTSVHYRNVDEKSWPTVAQYVQDIIEDFPMLRITHGRKVLEVRPVIDWDKGKAVEFLLESLGLNNSDDVLPIYIGDDKTDEDAFKVMREGNQGYGILVSAVPKESKALLSLRDTLEVKDFLKSLVRLKEVESRLNT